MKKYIIIASVIGFPTQLMNWGGCFESEKEKKALDDAKKELDDARKVGDELIKTVDNTKKNNYVHSLVSDDMKLHETMLNSKVICYCLSGRMFIENMTDEISENYKKIDKNNSLTKSTKLDQTFKLLSSYLQKAIEAEKKAHKYVEQPGIKLPITVYTRLIYSKELDYTYFSTFATIGYDPNLSKCFRDDLKYTEFRL